jgi:PAS fold
MNRAAERILDCDAAELTGKPVWGEFPVNVSVEVERQLRDVLRSQKPKSSENFDVQRCRWFLINMYPFRDGVSVLFRDISEKKQWELQREQVIKELRHALGQVRTLHGLIPICALTGVNYFFGSCCLTKKCYRNHRCRWCSGAERCCISRRGGSLAAVVLVLKYHSGRWESGKPAFGFPLFHPPSSPELWKCGNLACLWRDFQGARGKSGKPAVGFPRFPQPRHFHSSLPLGFAALLGRIADGALLVSNQWASQ